MAVRYRASSWLATGRPVELVFDNCRRVCHRRCGQVGAAGTVNNAVRGHWELMAHVMVVVESLLEAEALAATAAVLGPGRLGLVPPVRETGMPAKQRIAKTQEALAVPGDDRF